MLNKFPSSPFESADFDPRKLLRRRSSLVVADLPLRPMVDAHGDVHNDERPDSGGSVSKSDETSSANKGQANELGKKQPTAFHEPDANSLLDAFGF
jgi:hypothetical protein